MQELQAAGTYESVIGLEVHCQLQTASKAFSPDSARFGGPPNHHVDPISLGHPGTLPVLSGKVVEYAVRLGLAMNCDIAERSILARKHYFYPDLPKGYQISQYEAPICTHGHIEIAPGRRIGIARIHIEEDAGKSLHDQNPYATLLDFNRCGVPLLEIVSEPDLRSASEAATCMQKIRQLVRYLGISDGNMEEGSLRCDANVSVRKKGADTLGTKTEIKNMNSFRHVERAIAHEVARQIELVSQGEAVIQETRLWDNARGETRSMRSKEEAHDYRYFPDPDLPPILVTPARRAAIAMALPELPDSRRARYMSEYRLPEYDAALLTDDRPLADYFEGALAELRNLDPRGAITVQAKMLSNLVMGDVLRICKERGVSVAAFPVESSRLACLAQLRLQHAISSSGAQTLFEVMLVDDRPPEELAREHNLLQVSDESTLQPIVESVLEEHPRQVTMYHGGKSTLIGFFIGQVMRRFEGSADPKMVRAVVMEALKACKPC